MERLQQLMNTLRSDIDCALITAPVNRRYYTGFPSSAGAVLATRDQCYFIIDSRYFEAAQKKVTSCQVILQDQLTEQITELAAKHGVKTMALESEKVSLEGFAQYQKDFPQLQLLTDNRLSDAINKQRQIKSQDEIDSIQQAQALADDTFTYILNYIAAGKTEREIALEMEFYSRKKGSEGPSFEFIVVSGKNSSLPHGVPSDKVVEQGDFLTMDFGAIVNGYPSDMTRTVAVGKVSEKQRKVYDTVLEAQLKSVAAVKAGAVCSVVDAVARDLINEKDGGIYKGCFGHGLGHSLGLEVHENPRFNTVCDTALEPGMVMSVEPGIYLAGEFGVRIEDIVVVTKEGCKNFCTSKKELIIL